MEAEVSLSKSNFSCSSLEFDAEFIAYAEYLTFMTQGLQNKLRIIDFETNLLLQAEMTITPNISKKRCNPICNFSDVSAVTDQVEP